MPWLNWKTKNEEAVQAQEKIHDCPPAYVVACLEGSFQHHPPPTVHVEEAENLHDPTYSGIPPLTRVSTNCLYPGPDRQTSVEIVGQQFKDPFCKVDDRLGKFGSASSEVLPTYHTPPSPTRKHHRKNPFLRAEHRFIDKDKKPKSLPVLNLNEDNSVWTVREGDPNNPMTKEALMLVNAAAVCGRTRRGGKGLSTATVVYHFTKHYGPHWHCVAGNHQTAWRIWYDQPDMIWLETDTTRLILFRREPVSPLIDPQQLMKMKAAFEKIAKKTLKKWRSDPDIQRPLVVREELTKKFGGWWQCVVGKTDEYETGNYAERGRLWLLKTQVDCYTFTAWLG